jgi:hypothetical protein
VLSRQRDVVNAVWQGAWRRVAAIACAVQRRWKVPNQWENWHVKKTPGVDGCCAFADGGGGLAARTPQGVALKALLDRAAFGVALASTVDCEALNVWGNTQSIAVHAGYYNYDANTAYWGIAFPEQNSGIHFDYFAHNAFDRGLIEPAKALHYGNGDEVWATRSVGYGPLFDANNAIGYVMGKGLLRPGKRQSLNVRRCESGGKEDLPFSWRNP